MKTVDVFIGEPPKDKNIQNVCLKITHFENLKIVEFKDNVTTQVNFSSNLELRDIFEFTFEKSVFVLKGFSKTEHIGLNIRLKEEKFFFS